MYESSSVTWKRAIAMLPFVNVTLGKSVEKASLPWLTAPNIVVRRRTLFAAAAMSGMATTWNDAGALVEVAVSSSKTLPG